MSRLFLMRRPGIIVVHGTVKEVGEELVIENEYPFPVSGPGPARVHLQVGPAVANMRLKKGASIIASTTDSFDVEMLLDGGETPRRDFALKAYTVRYSGSFDFEARGDQKESHVILGSVVNAFLGKNKQQQPMLVCNLMWQQLGKGRTARICLFDGALNPDSILKKKVAAITGPARTGQNGEPIFVAKELVVCEA